jgi:hypothetical protein
MLLRICIFAAAMSIRDADRFFVHVWARDASVKTLSS